MSIPGYEIQVELGRSALGDHRYQARQLSTGRLVLLEMDAVFRTDPFRTGDPDQRQRRYEALALLDHPNILPIIDLGRFDAYFYRVRPFVEGKPLEEHLHAGPPDDRQAARWARQAANAVQYAHEHGIFHPTLGTHDLLVTSRGEVVLTAFDDALVRFLNPPMPAAPPDAVTGIPAYLAPEQVRGRGAGAPSTRDVWALGTLLFRLATDRFPFIGGSALEVIMATLEEPVPGPRSLRADLDTDLETIILRCLQKQPEDRYPEVSEMLADLDCFLEGRPLGRAEQPTLVGRMSRWVRGWWGATPASG
jgi:serine/threonine protein kinase